MKKDGGQVQTRAQKLTLVCVCLCGPHFSLSFFFFMLPLLLACRSESTSPSRLLTGILTLLSVSNYGTLQVRCLGVVGIAQCPRLVAKRVV
jgi:hypothetical protein